MDEAAKTPPPLPDDPVALKALIGEKLELISRQETRIKVLEEQLALLRHKQFAARSEKASPDQISLFNEAEVSAEAPPATEDGRGRRSNAINCGRRRNGQFGTSCEIGSTGCATRRRR